MAGRTKNHDLIRENRETLLIMKNDIAYLKEELADHRTNFKETREDIAFIKDNMAKLATSYATIKATIEGKEEGGKWTLAVMGTIVALTSAVVSYVTRILIH
jgi:chromosome segregation ATPase